MKKLVPLRDSAMVWFDRIVPGKRNEAELRALRVMVRRRYRLYEQRAPALERFRPARSLADTDRAGLLSCYEVSTIERDRLRAKILDHCGKQLNGVCPYCGLNEPDTLDHYLPKAKDQFPEFSVCHLNLVPCCGRCNRIRGAWRRKGKRCHFHFYFDHIEEVRAYLKASITIPVDAKAAIDRIKISYSVMMPDDGDPEFYARFEHHCSGKLDLLNRYGVSARRKFAEYAEDAATVATDAKELQVVLDGMRARRQARLGANHWEVVLLRAMADSPAVIDWCLRYNAARQVL